MISLNGYATQDYLTIPASNDLRHQLRDYLVVEEI
jgi:hypothetical protein